MDKTEMLVPNRYNVYMQDLDTIHLELHLLGFVKTIGQARTMANAFREAFIRQGKHATVFFQHVDD